MMEPETVPPLDGAKDRALLDASRDVSGNRIRQEAGHVIQSLIAQLADPTYWQLLKTTQTTVRLSRYNRARLAKYQSEGGFRSLNETVTFLLESSRQENMILPSSLKLIFHDDRPITLSGPSGTGKSLFLKQVMPNIPGPLFLVDLANEHSGLKKIGIGEFFEIKWSKATAETRLKFVPSANLDVSKGELRTIFNHLNMIKMDGHSPDRFPSGALSNWTILIEESHRLANESAFRNFLSESRKFTRKILVVSSDPSLYSGICRLLKPPPLEELLPKAGVPPV